MSAPTRRRKSKGKRRNRNRANPVRPVTLDMVGFDAADRCDCPACSGVDFDPGQVIDELTADLTEFEDPLDAEMTGAVFVSACAYLGEAFERALVDQLIPEFEEHATADALAVLLSIAAVAPARCAEAASAAAHRLVALGLARPRWAAELDEPVTVTDCVRLYDTEGAAAVLGCVLRRGGRSHAFVMSVDEFDCGAARDIMMLDAGQLPDALATTHAGARDGGVEIVTEALDPAEFRWHVERALDARAVHDGDRIDDGLPTEEDDVLGYPALAVLLRARMAALPAPDKPPDTHSDTDDRGLAALRMLAQLVGAAPFGTAPFGTAPPSRLAAPPVPPKRKKNSRAAPVYQIKVGLRGSKPPIWRRLEVAADISLARLHEVIQAAFAWDGGHLHVFTTPYGEFGVADTELGHQAEAAVTLEQVAPSPRSKITYTYDFGDDWEHDIVVEKMLDPRPAAPSARCTGGRRAAPPDDCGGLWGYAELAEILSDPTHPEHEDRLDWLGLHDASDFDPSSFDAQAVSRRLARVR